MLAFLIFILLLVALTFLYSKSEESKKAQANYADAYDQLVNVTNLFNNLQQNVDSHISSEVARIYGDSEKRHESRYEALKQSIPKTIEIERAAAVKTQRSIIKGKISEQMAVFMQGFNYESSDSRFLGSPVDFVVFNGLSQGMVKEVILIDIKTGKANLTSGQRQIKDCIDAGKVRFEKLTMNDDFELV